MTNFIPLMVYMYIYIYIFQSSEDTVSVSTYSEDSPPGSPSLLFQPEEPAPRPQSLIATPTVQKRVSPLLPPRAAELPSKKRSSTEVMRDPSTARLVSIEDERLKIKRD